MDSTQLLLTIVLSLTTILLIVVGIQLVFVLKELRQTLRRVNKIVDGFEGIGVGLEHGLGELVGFMNGFKTVIKAVEIVTGKKNGN